MAFRLPAISSADFAAGIAALTPEPLAAAAQAALYAHYLELRRWNERLGLIGPGTADEVLVRHFGESLAALPLIPRTARHGLDLGSGGGFPGLVLAAARPGLQVTLVEARERKWAFLSAAARRAALPCRCLNVRVASPLPAELPQRIDLVTVRALKLEPEVLKAFARRLTPEGSMLLWIGEREPILPPELRPRAIVHLAGGEKRRILQLQATAAVAGEGGDQAGGFATGGEPGGSAAPRGSGADPNVQEPEP
jgi:16S rRNA (guanine527-N7)-methyltransferase